MVEHFSSSSPFRCAEGLNVPGVVNTAAQFLTYLSGSNMFGFQVRQSDSQQYLCCRVTHISYGEGEARHIVLQKNDDSRM
jgi:hypothetical protein